MSRRYVGKLAYKHFYRLKELTKNNIPSLIMKTSENMFKNELLRNFFVKIESTLKTSLTINILTPFHDQKGKIFLRHMIDCTKMFTWHSEIEVIISK